ncbi:MAG: hypothetical protein JXX14_09850 [Deltaproteobacteria bacterium]|nr:hypothetical protein [Deltaproteobacteria bacterium]
MKKAISILKSKHPVCGISATAISCVLMLQAAFPKTANASEPEVPVDGLASVISFNSADESSSALILNSDVALLARILLVTYHGAKWSEQPVDNAIQFNARRLGVTIRLLAHVATQVGEKVDATRRNRWMTHFSKMAGGANEVKKILQQSGTSQTDLEYWFSNMQLCRIQLQYMIDKIQMPDEAELQKLFRLGNHPLAGANWKEARPAFEKIVRNKKIQRVLTDWLSQFESQGNIRFP